MYAALWRRLPGPGSLRVAICLALFALVVAVCFTWLFPWIAAQLPVNDPTVDDPTLAGAGIAGAAGSSATMAA